MPLAELTRAGWSNTAGQQRSTLQRVSYALVDDVLKRSYTTSLDTVLGNKPQMQDLLTSVKPCSCATSTAIRPGRPSGRRPICRTPEAVVRPVAVEITIEFKDWGRVRRLIEVAG